MRAGPHGCGLEGQERAVLAREGQERAVVALVPGSSGKRDMVKSSGEYSM